MKLPLIGESGKKWLGAWKNPQAKGIGRKGYLNGQVNIRNKAYNHDRVEVVSNLLEKGIVWKRSMQYFFLWP
jgi:hypothetical protein